MGLFVPLVQTFFSEIDQFVFQVKFDGFINIRYVGYDSIDISALQTLISAVPHSPGDKNLGIGNIVHHGAVPGIGGRVKAVFFSRPMLIFMMAAAKGLMSGFISFFFAYHFAILYSEYRIVGGIAKVLTDGSPIISDNRDFHYFIPP